MAAGHELWSRKMVARNIPADWSADMLVNFVEVATRADLEEDGVEHFCNVHHTALLTFDQPITDEHVQHALAETRNKGKPVLFVRVDKAPCSILIRDLCPALTHDNLLYYFDSKRAGGEEGGVKEDEEGEGVEVFEDYSVAIVTFISAEVAASVLNSKQHSPSRGTTVTVEPCYEHFHKHILYDLTRKTEGSKDGGDFMPKAHQARLTYQQSEACSVSTHRTLQQTQSQQQYFASQQVNTASQRLDSTYDSDGDEQYQKTDAQEGGSARGGLSVSESWRGDDENTLYRQRGGRGERGKRNRRRRNKGVKDQGQNAWVEDKGYQGQNAWGQGQNQGHYRPPSPGRGYRGRGQQGEGCSYQGRGRGQQSEDGRQWDPMRGQRGNRFQGRGGRFKRPPSPGSGRGRGQGGRGYNRLSEAETAELFSFEPAQDSKSFTSGQGHSQYAQDQSSLTSRRDQSSLFAGEENTWSLPSGQGHLPQPSRSLSKPVMAANTPRVIRLDAECNPVPIDEAQSATRSRANEQSYISTGKSNPLEQSYSAMAEPHPAVGPGGDGSWPDSDLCADSEEISLIMSHQPQQIPGSYGSVTEFSRGVRKPSQGDIEEQQNQERQQLASLREVEVEKQRLAEERQKIKRQEEDKRKIEEEQQRKLMERENDKSRAMEVEKQRIAKERQKIEEQRQKIEEQRRLLDEERKKIEEDRHRNLMEKQMSIDEVKARERKAEEEKQRLEEDKRSLEFELDKFKNQESWKHKSYKLRLLPSIGDMYRKSMSVTVSMQHDDDDDTIEVRGHRDQVQSVKLGILKQLQELEEEAIPLSPTVTSILLTNAGKLYMDQLCRSHDCAYELQEAGNRIVCAGVAQLDVGSFVGDVQRNMLQKTYKANGVPRQQLEELKQDLEDRYPLARVTFLSGSSDVIVVEGLDGDVDLTGREIDDHCSHNKQQQFQFQLQSPLQSEALKRWFAEEVNNIKHMVWENGGKVVAEKHDCYTLTYKCNREFQQIVQDSLDSVRIMLCEATIDLLTEVKSYSERALIISGINKEGLKPVASHMESKLKEDGGWDVIIHFNLPQTCTLPTLRYHATKHQVPKKSSHLRPRQAKSGHSRRHNSGAIRPFQAQIGKGKGKITVKSGDIASEQVDGIVLVVGEDMDLKNTAVGQAILKSQPSIAQLIPPQSQAGRVIPVQSQQGQWIFIAVLSSDIQQEVAAVTQSCLQWAVKQGIQTLAIPPLGCGRRFKFPLDFVAKAMAETANQFLLQNRTTLQDVIFIVYDTNEARKFREITKGIVSPPLPAFLGFAQPVDSTSGSDTDHNDGDSDDDRDTLLAHGMYGAQDMSVAQDIDRQSSEGSGDVQRNSGSEAEEEDLDFFQLDDDEDKQQGSTARLAPVLAPSKHEQILVCVRDRQVLTSVKTSLLRLLKSRFVVEEVIGDMRTFRKLGSKAVDDIKSEASKNCVVLSTQNRGGKEVLLVRGMADTVYRIMETIRKAIDDFNAREQKPSSDHPHRPSRSRGAYSSARTMELPSYWKIKKDGIFKSLEQFVRDRVKRGSLYTLSGSELTEVQNVIQSTWQQHHVGHGKDGVNLHHRGIQVKKLERLENPNLWEMYSTHRDRLMRRLQLEQRGKAFLPLEKVKGSSGPVKTTVSMNHCRAIGSEVLHKVNEHYLFHGTKKQYIDAIIEQGLDCRIASDKAMLGRGVYASESSTKADQYTDDKQQRTSGDKTMILMRVLLGEPYINKQPNPYKYNRPPCKKCYKDVCVNCGGSEFFDSVIDDAGRNFREFVIYDKCMCYPEYFITYQRL